MFAEIEARIVARLREAMPAEVHVGTLAELEDVKDMRQRAPAAWVIYDGFGIAQRQPGTGRIVAVRQDWFVVLAAKSAKGAGATDNARAAASELSALAFTALIGLDLGADPAAPSGRYLQAEDAPGPEYDAGYCHVPLAFSNAATFKASA
jgi:hypothetical protein